MRSRLLCGLIMTGVLAMAAGAPVMTSRAFAGDENKEEKKPARTKWVGTEAISIPEKVTGERGDFIRVAAKLGEGAKEVQWFAADPGLKIFPPELLKDSRVAVVSASRDGTYKLYAYTAVDNVPTPPVQCWVVVGKPGPGPDPGPGPGPDPGPGPGPDPGPGPGPDPGPTPKPPVPTDKLMAMIIEETEDRTDLPRRQLEIITSAAFREWINGKVGKDEKGSPLFRIYDQHTDVSNDAKIWQDAMKVDRKAVPWLLLSNGRTGYSGPLPLDVAEMKALVEKYAGAGKAEGEGKLDTDKILKQYRDSKGPSIVDKLDKDDTGKKPATPKEK